jgi:hypothetical protein
LKIRRLVLAIRVRFTADERRRAMQINNRDAKTGRFVTSVYAKKHPSTTVSEAPDPSSEARRPKNVRGSRKVLVQRVERPGRGV